MNILGPTKRMTVSEILKLLRPSRVMSFLAHRDHATLRDVTQLTLQQATLYDFEAVDGIRHEIWKIDASKTTEI